MESPNTNAFSRIPRPSRLPVPKGMRPSPSRESLRSSTTALPRLRQPFKDQLSATQGRSTLVTAPYSPLRTEDYVGIRDNDESVFKKPLSRPSSSHQQSNRHASNQNDNGSTGEAYCVPENEPPTRIDSVSRKPRLSLSERTMETLAQITSSPAARRTSIFNNNDSPLRPPSRQMDGSRPGSSYKLDTAMLPPVRSVGSRPSSSAGYRGESAPLVDFRSSTSAFDAPPSATPSKSTPQRLLAPKTLKTPLRARSSANLRSEASSSKLPSPIFDSPMAERSPSPVKTSIKTTTAKPAAKTLASRPLRPRASVGGLYRKPSAQALDTTLDPRDGGLIPKKLSPTFSNTSSEGASITSGVSKQSATTVTSIDSLVTPRKTSNALREQIAKAKAAKRAQAAVEPQTSISGETSDDSSVIPLGTFDFGLGDDPFNQNKDRDGGKGLLRKRIDAARTDGRLNISAMNLKEIPDEVMNMYNLDSINGHGSAWAESVDLTRFVAADNELESLGDDVFPDVDPQELLEDEDSRGNQFGGLETLDLHGNMLKTVPPGLRRLEMLTTLNLSNNKLENDCLDVISQIPSLRDLKIANNNLSGELNLKLARLRNLEVLDVRVNRLSSLPESIFELVRLRVLVLTGNIFKALPFETLHRLPLIELLAARNKLEGVLVSLAAVEFPNLQILDVTGNSLTSLTSGQLTLPVLHQLNCSMNRLTSLPDMTSWKSLLTLAAEDNNISSIPEGFVTLSKLRSVDLTGNNIKILDDRIGTMAGLDILRISGNPLKEKKFSGMTTEDLKRLLKTRLAPVETELPMEENLNGDVVSTPSPGRSASADWPIKVGGILDRSNTSSYNLNPVVVAQIASSNTIRELQLHHNVFKEIPSSIGFFAATLTTLSLAHNELNAATFLTDDLDLPVLTSLNLSSNTFNSCTPLTTHLHAPALDTLDISFNRLTSLPVLRTHFPRLSVLLASHNTIRELSPDAVKGLRVLDCSSNDLNSLNARIGLLGGKGGLAKLDVSGNRFRVPKYTVLEKGTEATLAWLRDRIPADELPPVEAETEPGDIE